MNRPHQARKSALSEIFQDGECREGRLLHLPRRLAARLQDTPRRQFSAKFGVTREEEVDADKRTDIQVAQSGVFASK